MKPAIKRRKPDSLEQGFILLDSVIALFVICVFLIAMVGFYSSLVHSQFQLKSTVEWYLDGYNTFYQNRKIVFEKE